MPHTVHGLVPVLATPFHPDGSIDLPSLRRLTDFQLASGVDGVAVFGMASENFALTATERSRVLAEVVDVVGDAVPVVAGVSATSTITAIEQAREAEAGGATALMVLPPYLVKPNPGQLVDFYRDVAASVDIEIMVQDAPAATGVAMSPWIIVELSKIDGVTSVKIEAPPTAPKVAALADALGATDALGAADVLGAADSSRGSDNIGDGDQFAILGGQNAQFCLEEYARGAIGTMPACEFPDVLAPILADWNTGRRPEARAAFARLLQLVVFGLQPGIAWAVHKQVLVARGLIDHATVRSPARPLDEASRGVTHRDHGGPQLRLTSDAGASLPQRRPTCASHATWAILPVVGSPSWGEPARANKMSITVPADVAAEIRARAGHGRVSAYVTNALLRQLEHDRLGDLVAELEEAHEPATDEELAAARSEWLDP